MQTRKQRVNDLRVKADKFEFSVFSWSRKVSRAIERSLPKDAEIRPSLKKVLRKMRFPDQGNFHKLLDLVSDEMTLVHGAAWVKSALNAIRPYTDDQNAEMPSVELMQIHDALDNWTLNVLMYLRASGLAMRHAQSQFDAQTRRDRLAGVLRIFRSDEKSDYRLKAARIYSKFRYQPVVLASNVPGRMNMFMDPTVSVSFTEHRRVAAPAPMPSYTFGDPGTSQLREANYVHDYRSFRESLKDLSTRERDAKLDFWLAARGLSRRPRRFTYATQVRNWDEHRTAYVTGELMSTSRVITTGNFDNSTKIHPCATHWKRPLGSREWSSWHRWWKR